MTPFRLTRGDAPLLVSVPHAGTEVPADIASRLTDHARTLPDTDWFVDRLYDFVGDLGATLLVAPQSRYVVDVNRPPDDASLYPGQATTGLVPLTDFEGTPLYVKGEEPGAPECTERLETVWRPYHQALAAELSRLRQNHPRVLLWDAHSILSRVPRLFDGVLPDLNFGTADGASCAPAAVGSLIAAARSSPYSSVLNGRFKGGYITRRYGRPAEGIDAVQLELAQSAYMDEATGAWDDIRAARVRPVIRNLIEAALAAITRPTPD